MEDLTVLNARLADQYGYFDGLESYPFWRVVFADDEVEKRIVTHNKHGHELIYPEVKEIKKYKGWNKGKYVLERAMPIIGPTDLIVKISYEPVFTFQDKDRNFLPPNWLVIEIVIYSVYEASSRAINANQNGQALYKHPLAGLNTEEQMQVRQQEIDAIKEYFSANETEVGDSLAYGGAVVVPRNYDEVQH